MDNKNLYIYKDGDFHKVGSGSENIEGTAVKSTGVSSGYLLTADGSGGSTWSEPAEQIPSFASANVGDVLTVGEDGLEWAAEEVQPVTPAQSSGAVDDIEVKISTNSGSTWSDSITLKDFIDNCEAGDVYTTVGTQAKLLNLFGDGKDFRIILIGTNVDSLASDSSVQAKTTWHFYDMPFRYVRLGLPFNIADLDIETGRAIVNSYLDGTNASKLYWYPSNRGGYITATGLLEALHVIYEGLPSRLKHAIKTVSKTYIIRRQRMEIGATGGTETDYDATAYVAQKLFCLSAKELGSSSYGNEQSTYPYFNENSKRKRYLGSSALDYWTRTASSQYASDWVIITNSGSVSAGNVTNAYGIAPGFCI